MTTIFKTFPLIKQSLAQRIFNQYPEENAIIELNNLLSERDIMSVLEEDIEKIQTKYGIDLRIEYALNLEEFYVSYLNYCLNDKVLEPLELESLHRLKVLFGLSDKVVNELHQKIGGQIYQQSFKDAVSDGRLSSEEQQFLLKLEQTLQLPQELISKISRDVKGNFVKTYLVKATEDSRLSPSEEEELYKIATSLGVTLTLDCKSQQRLQQLKYYWSLENLELPLVESELKLQKNEKCYFISADVEWYKVNGRNRTVIQPNNNPKDVFIGAEHEVAVSYPYALVQVDRGRIHLTDSRIIFDGMDKKITIKLDKILRIKTFTDGVELMKETGKNPIFRFSERADEFGIMLNRLLKEK